MYDKSIFAEMQNLLNLNLEIKPNFSDNPS